MNVCEQHTQNKVRINRKKWVRGLEKPEILDCISVRFAIDVSDTYQLRLFIKEILLRFLPSMWVAAVAVYLDEQSASGSVVNKSIESVCRLPINEFTRNKWNIFRYFRSSQHWAPIYFCKKAKHSKWRTQRPSTVKKKSIKLFFVSLARSLLIEWYCAKAKPTSQTTIWQIFFSFQGNSDEIDRF